MPLNLRGIFKVQEVREYAGRGFQRLVKLESTQVTSQMFGARIEVMTFDPVVMMGFPLNGEVCVEFSPLEQAAKKVIAPPLR